jgi:hypothetical protein
MAYSTYGKLVVQDTNFQDDCMTQICEPYFTWVNDNNKWQMTDDFVNDVLEGTRCSENDIGDFLNSTPHEVQTQIDCVAQAMSVTLLHEVSSK